MANTDKVDKLEDVSANSTIQIKVEATRGRGTDVTSQWDLAQPLNSRQAWPGGKYCPNSCVELKDETGPDSPETTTTEVAPDQLHSPIEFPTVLLHLFTPEEYISPTTNSGIWEITNCDLYEDPTLVGLQRLFGRFAPAGSYIHFVGVISKRVGQAGSVFGSRVVTGEGIQFKTDEHIRAWLMFMGGADIIQFVGIICPQF